MYTFIFYFQKRTAQDIPVLGDSAVLRGLEKIHRLLATVRGAHNMASRSLVIVRRGRPDYRPGALPLAAQLQGSSTEKAQGAPATR